MTKPRILLTHTPEMRRNYYGEPVAQIREILQGRVPEGAVNAEHAHRLQRFVSG